MPDIIQLLPDSVANQIAAGEVIQRPASVIKELVENAIDAGANSITIIIKDAGRTLIQVADNGKGMSETDARMAFERHATSKIRKADDLFAIRSMGFRGEALASMAAVAEVTLQTRREEDELGTEINIRATDVISQENVGCSKGANFSVKNLFFNVPARRKFLKSDTYEFRLIVSEIHRVALPFYNLEFKLIHNTAEILTLPSGNLRQRIAQLFGKNMNSNLVEVKSVTSIVNVSGFIGKPEIARKSQSEQFFFVNNRYMRNPYFHKAVLNAYDRILAPELQPAYFIFLEIAPESIDINIHPTKTEIKFEEEQAIWQILNATVKEALGKFNVIPSLDFNNEAAIDIPLASKATQIRVPSININPNFNPFDNERSDNNGRKSLMDNYFKQSNLAHWESLYTGFENEKKQTETENQQQLFSVNQQQVFPTPGFMQLKNKYILAPAKSGLMIIDQKRAHECILYEQYLSSLQASGNASQQTLFPQVLELNANDHNQLMEYIEQINKSGFDIRDFGNNSIAINGYPAGIDDVNPKELIDALLSEMYNHPQQTGKSINEYIASVLSKATAITYGKQLGTEEMRNLVDRLFACSNHNYNPDGKPVVTIVTLDEIEKKL